MVIEIVRMNTKSGTDIARPSPKYCNFDDKIRLLNPRSLELEKKRYFNHYGLIYSPRVTNDIAFDTRATVKLV